MPNLRRLVLPVIALSVAIAAPLSARSAEPEAAKSLLTGAERAAKAKKKIVLLMFHASW